MRASRRSLRSNGQLKHRARPAIPGELAWWYLSPDRADPGVAVEEDEIERKAHSECVDAGAARDQQAGTGLVEIEVSEAQEARPNADGDTKSTHVVDIAHPRERKLGAQNRSGGQIAETARGHWPLRTRPPCFSPL